MIDISMKISNEKPTIKIAEGKIYEINNSKNNVLLMDQKIKNKKLTETEVMDEIIKQLLGEKAFKEIEAMDLPITSYKAIYIGIMSAISGESYEETETRFQKKAK